MDNLQIASTNSLDVYVFLTHITVSFQRRINGKNVLENDYGSVLNELKCPSRPKTVTFMRDTYAIKSIEYKEIEYKEIDFTKKSASRRNAVPEPENEKNVVEKGEEKKKKEEEEETQTNEKSVVEKGEEKKEEEDEETEEEETEKNEKNVVEKGEEKKEEDEDEETEEDEAEKKDSEEEEAEEEEETEKKDREEEEEEEEEEEKLLNYGDMTVRPETLENLIGSQSPRSSDSVERRASTMEASIEKLPKDWKTVQVERRSGIKADRYFISPEGRRYRSIKDVERRISGDERRKIKLKYSNPCSNLPPGWKVIVRQRGAWGGTAGTYNTYVSPAGKKFRSVAAVLRFLRQKKLKTESGSLSEERESRPRTPDYEVTTSNNKNKSPSLSSKKKINLFSSSSHSSSRSSQKNRRKRVDSSSSTSSSKRRRTNSPSSPSSSTKKRIASSSSHSDSTSPKKVALKSPRMQNVNGNRKIECPISKYSRLTLPSLIECLVQRYDTQHEVVIRSFISTSGHIRAACNYISKKTRDKDCEYCGQYARNVPVWNAEDEKILLTKTLSKNMMKQFNKKLVDMVEKCGLDATKSRIDFLESL